MKILLVFLLSGLLLKAIKVLFNYVLAKRHDFKGSTFFAHSNSTDYVNSFSSLSATITSKEQGVAIIALPTEAKPSYSGSSIFESGINDPLGKQSIAQLPLKLTA